MPDGLAAALAANPAAAAFFATLKGASRYATLYRIGAVKKAETRARKIADFVGMLERGETFHERLLRRVDGFVLRTRGRRIPCGIVKRLLHRGTRASELARLTNEDLAAIVT